MRHVERLAKKFTLNFDIAFAYCVVHLVRQCIFFEPSAEQANERSPDQVTAIIVAHLDEEESLITRFYFWHFKDKVIVTLD